MSHPQPNFNRMLQLIDEVFATRHDPGQLQVNKQQLKKLEKIHPATLSQSENENGPLIWVLVIPTVNKIMLDFLEGTISEKELLKRTPLQVNYDCIYLCSATTLPESRGKGETKKLCVKAIKEIQKDHSIDALFVWPFTKEGESLAESVARECGLNLFKKTAQH
ncbi:MAG: GCN5-related N-acetyltransferase (GNAT)-like protein [Bacteroidetes bacterium]|nr:GCN5-related N-acetyltransferase (GNAT)-like protein [Bacteroidota bacterium]